MTVIGVWNDGSSVAAARLRLLTVAPFITGTGPLVVTGGVRYTAGDPCLVTVHASEFAVNIAVGIAVVPGTEQADQAGYPVAVTATEKVTLVAAETQPRYDLIALKVTDTGTSASTYTATAVKGTAQASPTRPGLPANSLELAEVYVPANATRTDLDVTDTRQWLRPVAPPTASPALQITSTGQATYVGGTWRSDASNGATVLSGTFTAPDSGAVWVTVSGNPRVYTGSTYVYGGVQITGPGGYDRLPTTGEYIGDIGAIDASVTGEQRSYSNGPTRITGLTAGEEYTATWVTKSDGGSLYARRILVVPDLST